MKPATIVFLAAELLDLGTTLALLSVPGAVECNPLATRMTIDAMIISKVSLALAVAYLMGKFDLKRLAWILPGIAILPALWNGFILITLLIYL